MKSDEKPSATPSSGADGPPPEGATPAAGAVRAELRRLGYLDHQVERFLLQDALRRTPPWRALAQLSLKVGLLIGSPAAVLAAVALAAGNGHLRHSPFDLLPLTAHLLVPAVLGLAGAFLALAGLLALIVGLTHNRRIEALSFALALLASALSVGLALWQGRAFVADLPGWLSGTLALLVPALAWGVFKVTHGGLLSLAIRLTEAAPEQPFTHGRWWVALLVLGTFLVMVPTALEARHGEKPGAAFLPEVAGDRVLVIGVDGVVPQEIDFLLASGEVPTMSRLLENGGVLETYRREASSEPITFWTTLATGRPAAEHGLESLDTYRPALVQRPLRRSGLLRHWWHLLTPGLAEYRPLLASQRRSWTFWELAARGGAPAVVVNWWGTFPAERSPGRIIAHGAYQLLASDAPGAVYPPALAGRLEERAHGARLPPALRAGLERVLPAEAESVLENAMRPDVFYRREFLRAFDRLEPRAAALYLPGLDIAAGAELGSLAFSELLRYQLQQVDTLVARALRDEALGDGAPGEDATEGDAVGTALIVFDPGRRGGGEGRALLWRREACRGEPGELDVIALTSGVLRALGLPHHRQLPEPPDACTWPAPALVVESFGPRRSRQATVEGKEYLESLQSLGYL